MNVLITGGAGFVGAQLAFFLRDHSYSVVVMDNLARRGSEANLLAFKHRGIPFFHGDVRNQEDFIGLPKDIEVICHTSAQPSVVYGYANPMLDFGCNTLGTMNALEFARGHSCGFILWSTNKVYDGDQINQLPRIESETRWMWDRERILEIDKGLHSGFHPDYGFSEDLSIDGNQHSIYGLTKVMADLACQEYSHAYGIPTIVNRFSCLAGPGQFGKSEQGWVVWFAIAFHFGLPLRLMGWKGKQVRDILFIEDMCRLVQLQLENLERVGGQVFNIGGGTSNTLSLIEAMSVQRQTYNRKVGVTFEEPPRRADHCIYVSDIRKAQNLLGWSPRVGIEEGYQQIVDWVKCNEDMLRPLYA